MVEGVNPREPLNVPLDERICSEARAPDDRGARWLTAMRAGDFEAAWTVSDAVLAGRDRAARDDPQVPYHERWVWDGRPLQGRQVLVRCYHGLGDTLQFCRFLAPLRHVAARVTVEVQPELAGLLAGMADRILPFDPARPLPPDEVDVEIMELPHALRAVPDKAPYLHAMPMPAARGRIGLCWAAGGWDPARSMPAGALHALVRELGGRALSVQRGPAAAALALPDPLHGSMDIAALASLVAGLDAVVTVDTMVAHLAGALGRPVFLLLKHEPDWRWGATCWYESVRKYPQQRAGEWNEAVALLAHDLDATFGDVEGS